MSFEDLTQKLTVIRAQALRQLAYGNFDALSLTPGTTNGAGINIDKLNALYDRVSNGQGDLTELYRESCQYGVQEQKFMQIEAKNKPITTATQAGKLQQVFHKITLKVRAKQI